MPKPAAIRSVIRAGVTLLSASLPLVLLESGARLFFSKNLAGRRTSLSMIDERIWTEKRFFIKDGAEGGYARYVTNSRDPVAEGVHAQAFLMPPKPGTYRIFCVGESSVMGMPYRTDPRKAFPGRLGEYLRKYYPNVEVINAGKGSTTSGQILKRVTELAGYRPDLIILYAGHNEYGYYYWQPEILKISPWVLRTDRLLEKSYLYKGLLRLFHLGVEAGDSKEWKKYEEGEDLTRFRNIIPEKEWERFSRNELVLCEKTFEANLTEILGVLRSKGVPLMVGTLVSNLKDFKPAFNLHSPALTQAQLTRWKDLRGRSLDLLAKKKDALAEEILREMLRLDPDYAETYYLLGQARYRAGDYDGARAYLISARDRSPAYSPDQRAPSSMNELIRGFCTKNGVWLVDIEKEFLRNPDDHGVPGDDLFHDNLHPNEKGYALIGELLGKRIRELDLPGSRRLEGVEPVGAGPGLPRPAEHPLKARDL